MIHKKLIVAFALIVIAFISVFTANAQITKSVLGVKLGVTTKHDIHRILPDGSFKSHTYRIMNRTTEYKTYDLHSISFAGIEWYNASFSFDDNGIVISVSFDSGYLGSSQVNGFYNDIYTALKSKYKKYEKDSPKSYFSYFTDWSISVKLSVEQLSCVLSYSLFNQHEYEMEHKLGRLRGPINTDEL